MRSENTGAALSREERQEMYECDSAHDMKQMTQRDLHSLLDVNVQKKEERENFDGLAVISEVKRNPKAAEREYIFFSSNKQEHTYPLHQSVRLGVSLDVVEAIYNSYPQAVTIKEPKTGNTALHLACNKQFSPEVLRFLLEKWPQAVSEKDHRGVTPLHIACALLVDVDVVSLLLDAWPDAIKEYCNGKTPLVLALNAARTESSYDLVQILLERWPSAAKVKDRRGSTPLHLACAQMAPFEIVASLLEAWPEAVMEKNYNDQTPASIAVGYSAPKYTQDLLWHVSQIIADQVHKIIIEEAVNVFTKMNWWGGVALVLNMHPTFVLSLDLDIKILPHLLSFGGRHCKVTTLSNMIANRYDLITDF
eukprot:CAMPEP_0185728310 /NCGR_PEP_ID=MMETSP1171-20130828/3692_1 /TAXON_ID=374046 /ORGANISM="Helicotheca tamensis, Strain CCMP826" /LENGTH=363 /DNA_ID=CAMNT_0028397001 /DNA_START=39 /DNA_END=1130 /DNA_ORIENTATION=+